MWMALLKELRVLLITHLMQAPTMILNRPILRLQLHLYKIYNVGNNFPTTLLQFINTIEEKLGIEAKKELLSTQPGDLPATYADIKDLVE
jgi:UDP-glucose 4-epimerase